MYMDYIFSLRCECLSISLS